MLRIFMVASVLLAGCVENDRRSDTLISLYPGHVAKAQGRIFWFPVRPEFDETFEMWRGEGAVEITSCIADPWPDGPGGRDASMAVSDRTSLYTAGN